MPPHVVIGVFGSIAFTTRDDYERRSSAAEIGRWLGAPPLSAGISARCVELEWG